MADLEQAVSVPKGIGGAAGGILTRKYAGVPAWVILLVVAGGAYLYIRSRSTYSPLGSQNDSGTATGDSAIGSEGGYQATGQPQIVFIPASSDSATNPDHPNHPAGQGGKGRNKGGPTHTGKGARGIGTGHHGKGPKSSRNRYPVRH